MNLNGFADFGKRGIDRRAVKLTCNRADAIHDRGVVAVAEVAGDLGEASVDRRAVGMMADYLADECQEAVLAGDDAALGFAFAGDVARFYPVERGVQRDLGLDGQVLCAVHVCLL